MFLAKEVKLMETGKLWLIAFLSLVGFWLLANWLT
jgi:hypothetical protein